MAYQERKVKFIDSTTDIHKYFESSSKNKRSRIKLSDDQVAVLETNFRIDSHPSHLTKNFLSSKLHIPLRNIQIWFQNRRAKEKTYNEESLRIRNVQNIKEYKKNDLSFYSKYYDNYFY